MLDKALNLADSYEIYLSLLTNHNSQDVVSPPPKYAKDMDFGADFPGSLIQSPHYENCRFNESVFRGSDSALTRLHMCGFYDCTLVDGDFRYCDFKNVIFKKYSHESIVDSCNFNYGNFIACRFVDTIIKGSSFREMIIESTEFNNCPFSFSSFERTEIKNCVFKDIDFSKITFRFCDLQNVIFKNVIIHALDLAKNSNLIDQLTKNSDSVTVFYGNGNIMSLDDAIAILPNLIPYYLKNENYYQAINIYVMLDMWEKAWSLFPNALKYSIQKNDFPGLQDLCSLASKLNIYDASKMKSLYNIIKSHLRAEILPYYQKKSYSAYMENIKNLLVDAPNEHQTAYIIIESNIEAPNIEMLMPLLSAIELNMQEIIPNLAPRIEISHNSPYNIILIISAALSSLLQVCQSFYYAFGGAKSIKELAGSKREKITKEDIDKNLQENNVEQSKHTNNEAAVRSKSKKLSLSLGKLTLQVESVEYFIM